MSLGLERAGMETIAFCEVEPFCREWLAQQWPEVPIFDDVRRLHAAAVSGGVDVVAGGFPCQDISVAGNGAGIDGERSGLWSEMFRIVCELRPRWVLAENVPALRTRGADRVLGDLESEGYACWPLVVGADDIGAPHRRKRVWIVAHRSCDAVLDEQQRVPGGRTGGVRDEGQAEPGDDGASVAVGLADCDGGRCQRERQSHHADQQGTPGCVADRCDRARVGDAACGGLGECRCSSSPRDRGDAHCADARVAVAAGARREEPGREHARPFSAVAPPSWPARPGQPQFDWEPPRVVPRAQPGLGGDTHGLPDRVVSAHRRARLRALGNSIVPQIVEAIGRAIMRCEA